MPKKNVSKLTPIFMSGACIYGVLGFGVALAVIINSSREDLTAFRLFQPGLPLSSYTTNPNTELSAFDDRVAVSFCTNQSVSPSQPRTFSGTTIVAYNCPKTNNPCSSSLCSGTSGRCEDVLNVGAECDSDISCGPSSVCNNATCQCQPIPGTTSGCLTDDDCPNVEDRNDCVTQRCTMSRCVEETLGECWFDGQCTEIDPRSACNITSCNCFTKPQCFTDDDCMDIDPGSICVLPACQNGVCVPQASVQCWKDEQCTQPTEFCNTTACGCQTRSPVLCEPPNIGCPILQGVGGCAEFGCFGGECIQTLVGISQCWRNEDCNQPSEFCNLDECRCDPVPVQPCEMDSQCLNISDRGPCVKNECLNGTCTEVTQGECWRNEQCISGFSCNDSCMCVSDSDTCQTGYDMRELTPTGSVFNLILCGYDVSIFRNFSEVLCVNLQEFGSEMWTIVTYIKNEDTWMFGSEKLTTISFEGMPPEGAAFVESNDEDMVFHMARFFDSAFPQVTRVEVYEISFGFLTLITTIDLPASNITEICLSVSGTDILAVNGDAFFLTRTGPSTWTLNQTITEPNNGTWFDCDLVGDSMVLSTLSSSVVGGETWYSYLFDEGTSQWMNVGIGMNSQPVNESWYVQVLGNNLRPNDENSFTVVSSISSYPTSTIQVFNSGASMLSGLQFITSTGPGKITSYERNTLISDTLFIGGMGDGLSFQPSWEGLYVRANDLYTNQPIFSVVNETGSFFVFSNWCPDDA